MGCNQSSATSGKYQDETKPGAGKGGGSGVKVTGVDHHVKQEAQSEDVVTFLDTHLRESFLFSKLSDVEIKALVQTMQFYVYQPGETVWDAGEQITHILVVAEGGLEVDDKSHEVKTRGQRYGDAALMMAPAKSAVKAQEGTVATTFWGVERGAARKLLQDFATKERSAHLNLINSVPVLSNLLDAQRNAILDVMAIQEFSAGATVFSEGEEGTSLYLISEGSFKVMIGGAEKRRMGPGAYFGERALIYDEPRSATIIAVEPAICAVIHRSGLERIFGQGLEQILSWNITALGFKTSVELSKLTEQQLNSVVRSSTIMSYKARAAETAAGVRCFVVLEGEVLVDGKKYSRGEFCCGKDPIAKKGASGVGKMEMCESDVKLAALTDENITFALEGTELGSKLDWNEKVEACKKVWIMRHISKKQRDIVINALMPSEYKKGDAVFQQGDVGTRFYVIKDGEVEISIKQKVIRTQGKGDYFGERALLFNEPRSANVVCKEDKTVLLSCDSQTFQQAIEGALKDYLTNRIKLQDTSVLLPDLARVRVLGIGSFGIVTLVEHNKTKTQYALKALPKADIMQSDQTAAVLQERRILLENEHPFLLKLVRTFKDNKFVYFLTECINGGELYDAIRDLGILTVSQAQFYVVSMLLAIASLHDRRTLYRDLKPENTLLDLQGYVKLIDFGCAKKLDTEGGLTYSVVGTPHYMAPEVILGRGYSYSVDLWGLGVCLYEFLCGPLPFGRHLDDPHGVITAVVTEPLTFPDHVREPKQRKVLKEFLMRNTDRRLGCSQFLGGGAEESLKHAFFADFDSDALLERKIEAPTIPRPTEAAPDLEQELKARTAQAAEQTTTWDAEF